MSGRAIEGRRPDKEFGHFLLAERVYTRGYEYSSFASRLARGITPCTAMAMPLWGAWPVNPVTMQRGPSRARRRDEKTKLRKKKTKYHCLRSFEIYRRAPQDRATRLNSERNARVKVLGRNTHSAEEKLVRRLLCTWLEKTKTRFAFSRTANSP